MIGTVPTRPSAVLVGRDPELGRLREALGGPGDGGAVLLGGDAGIGKSAVVARLVDETTTRRVLLGHCVGDVGTLPYLPFVEMLAALDGRERDLVDELVEAHPGLVPLVPRLSASARETARADLVEAVHAVLGVLGRDGGALVVVEDAHWADESTRELLTLLFTRGAPEGVSLVVTYRSDDVHRRHPLAPALAVWSRLPRLARLELGRLPDDAVRRIVRSAAALPDPLVDEVTARAEGNAFLAEELAVAAADGSAPELGRLLLGRVERLDDDAQAVVRVAAVVGRRVPHALLERVADVPPPTLRSALRQAVEHHVLEPWGELGYEFRHALLAEAVSEDLLPTERLQLHRACVEALREDERLGAAADLARHALAAGDRATALHASARAGDTARRMGGPAEALGHYETALGLTDDPEVVHDLTLRAAAAANGAGRAGRAVALLRARLADAEGAPRERAELLAALAYAARLTEERVDRLTVTAEALSLLDTDAPVALRVSVLTRRADALTDAGLVEEALAVADEAMGLAVEHGLHADRVDLSSNLAWLAQAAGDPDGSVRRLRGVVEGWRDTPDLAFLRALHILAVVHHRQSDLPAALAGFERVVDEARRAGLAASVYSVDALALAITVAFELGRWDHALELAERGRVGASPSARASIDAAVGYVHAARGEPDVEATLAAGRPFWPDDSRIPVQAGVAALDVLGRCGVLDRVLALRAELVTSLRAAWSVEHAPVEVRLAALVVGHLASAASTASAATRGRLLDEGERLAAEAALVWPEGSPGPELEGRMWLARLAAERLRLRRAAGEPVEAETLVTAWEDAVTLAEERGDPYESARARLRLGEVLLSTGDRRADGVLENVRVVAVSLGAAPLLTALDALATDRGPAQGLTAREHEVLALLALGRSNGEVGRELFITTKTASVHVSNILAKLGAASRGEAVAVARSTGLLDP